MAKKKVNISLPSVDELFTSQVERDSKGSGVVQPLSIASITPFPDHPFGVRDDQDMEQLVESIQEHGVLVPLTVRESSDGYVIVSGHRRKHAAEIVGLEELPCIVRQMSEDEATIAMVDSNLQRETILPSERAFAYSMCLEAMKHQGKRSDLTSAQLAQKSDGRWSRDILAEQLGVSKDKVQRFIRLTHLVKGLLDLVDSGRMKMLPAVELSYLSQNEQESLLDAIEANQCTPSHAQAIRMKLEGWITHRRAHTFHHGGGEAQPGRTIQDPQEEHRPLLQAGCHQGRDGEPHRARPGAARPGGEGGTHTVRGRGVTWEI